MQKQSRIGARFPAASLLLLFFFATTSHAQVEHRLTINGGFGYTPLVGQLGQRLDNGWGTTFGAGFVFSSHFEATAQVRYDGFGITSGYLRATGAPGGNAHLWSFTVDPMIRLGRGSKVSPYLVGGVGYYRRTVQFTEPVSIPVTIFNPFFGFISVLTPGNVVLSSVTQDGIGGSAGAGFDIRIGNRLAFFTEVRYHYADTGGIPTRMVPLTFGLRW